MVTTAAAPVRQAPAARAERAPAPALYETTIRHVRAAPLRNTFTYRGTSWLVDVDALPTLPAPARGLARFDASDHLGDPRRSLRQNIDAFLATHGLDLEGGRVLLLASPRSLGHVFNPISVWWCHRPDGSLACTVAEVHNTYGERHAYLVRTDERGRAETDKAFYVSPFFDVSGTYRMSLPEPDERLALTITLHRPEGPPFVASVDGRRRLPGRAGLLGLALRHPGATIAVATKIRWQGVRLWARRLPVINRPRHQPQKGVQ